jgi:glycine/sarcosine N-methyltransferase
MYDAFSEDYDRFVNWPSRLSFEIPLIEKLLQQTGARRVLDSACGTGMHTLELARRGYGAAGADLSSAMVARARANAAAAHLDVPFVTAGFGQMSSAFQNSPIFPFDALLCLGNSLPHLLSHSDLAAALQDFAGCLRPGGRLILQSRNFDALVKSQERWMEPQAFREGENEWLFVRFYDYRPDGLIDFNILTLERSKGENWRQTLNTTPLRPLLQNELTAILAEAGFNQIVCYGSLGGESFEELRSGNLVVTAEKKRLHR